MRPASRPRAALVSRGPENTQALAQRLARRLRGGEVLCLFGPLGSGKTTFVQGLARALGCPLRASSPSFMLVREYRTGRRSPQRLVHMDFYRLLPKELPNIGLEDYLSDPGATCAIEWAQSALDSLPADRLELRFAYPPGRRNPGTERRIELKAWGPTSARLLPRPVRDL